MSAVDGAVEAASAAAFAARATAEAGSSAQGEEQPPDMPRRQRGGGARNPRRGREAADAREAAARLDEELDAGEYVTEFVDLSEGESSGEEGEAATGGSEGSGGRERGGDGRRRGRARSPGGLTGIQKKQRRAGREGSAGEEV